MSSLCIVDNEGHLTESQVEYSLYHMAILINLL